MGSGLWRWRILVVMLCALTGGLIWSSLAFQDARHQEAAAVQRLAAVQGVQAVEGVPPATASADFAAQLSAIPSSQRIVEVLQQAAQSSNARLDAVRLQEHAATRERLARTDVSMELKAPYAAAKAVMGDVLSRLPTTTVTRMQWRVEPGGAAVQVSANLSVWGAPLASGAPAAPR